MPMKAEVNMHPRSCEEALYPSTSKILDKGSSMWLTIYYNFTLVLPGFTITRLPVIGVHL